MMQNRIVARLAMFTLLLAAFYPVFATGGRAEAAASGDPGDPYVLAHYYIWFDATSWNRAKIDFPLAGRYSSDEPSVMRRHVELAKEAGIDGFIVSWKSSATLDARLEQLIRIAEELDFKLAITYQGLDFNREPLPTDRIESDLDYFIENFAGSPAFDLFEKPLVALTGTWEFAAHQLDLVTSSRRVDLLLLATEKSAEDYERIAEFVDGDLYYWSSVNPHRNTSHVDKLAAMGNSVRSRGGIWIAPAAPGFDARLVGGESVVERESGETLRVEWQAALSSLPAAIGLISWNEFSENTHVEPSTKFGAEAIEVVADLTGSPVPSAIDFDSSAPEGSPVSFLQRMAAFLVLGVLVVGGLQLLRRRAASTGQPVREMLGLRPDEQPSVRDEYWDDVDWLPDHQDDSE